MSAQFGLAYFPRFEMTEEREARLKAILETPCLCPLDDLPFTDEDRDIFDSTVADHLSSIAYACDPQGCPESCYDIHHDHNGNPYEINVTGGLTWGDSPTESWDHIQDASRFDAIYDTAVEFAVADYAAATGAQIKGLQTGSST